MLIKVFNKDTTLVETIDSSKLDTKVHFHRNTRQEFTKDELASFKVTDKAETKTDKKTK